MAAPQFHLAIPSEDLAATEAFYLGLGCPIGRRNRSALTIDFFGHQVVAHLARTSSPQLGIYPRHFGVILPLPDLARVEGQLLALTPATTSRRTRFAGSPIEHDTVLALDPSGNQLEFKSYINPSGPLGGVDDPRVGDTRVDDGAS